jgi:hypothetical protein
LRASGASPLPSAPSLPASVPSEDMRPPVSAVPPPAMRAEIAENVSLCDAIFKLVPGQKIERQTFFSRNEVDTISNELSERGLSFYPVGIRVGGFGFVAFGNFDGQGVAVKIADQNHKDALLADREFMAAMQRTRKMQLVPKFIRGISETAMLQIRLPEKELCLHFGHGAWRREYEILLRSDEAEEHSKIDVECGQYVNLSHRCTRKEWRMATSTRVTCF